MFHAVVEGRRDYGALGWNVRYDFPISDLAITAQQLCHYVSTSRTLDGAIEAVSRLAGDCNYGGRLTDEHDHRVLRALLEDFCTPAILRLDYQAQGLAAYSLPFGALAHEEILAHAQRLPLEEPPDLFGLHPNASITKNLREMRWMCGELQRMGEVDGLRNGLDEGGVELGGRASSAAAGPSSSEGDEARVALACQGMLATLPKCPVDLEVVRSKYPMDRENSMNSVLVQELQRFNTLVTLITTSLSSLLQTVRGERLASPSTEELFRSVLLGEVPARWLRDSYPSQKTLHGYIADLRQRLTMLENWVAAGPPAVFRLSGFFFPQAFLTAVLQDHARRHRVEIDRLSFAFEFQDPGPTQHAGPGAPTQQSQLQAPTQGAYIYGLFLEGAAWIPARKCLSESTPGQLQDMMPIIKLRPTEADHEGSSHAASTLYQCPLYRTAARHGTLSTTGHSSNFVTCFDLPCGDRTPGHWTKRGVALIGEEAD